MNLNYVSLYRFRSAREEQVFRFPKGPGLFYLQGRNGSGKSSLWEAVYWCLFDKTSKGLRAGDVCTWGCQKGTVVEVGVEWDDGMPAIVRRTWGPNTWTLTTMFQTEPMDLAKEPQNPVLERLRMGFLAFSQCCVMPQGRDMFLDLKPEPKAALYAELLGLDRWLSRSQFASALADGLDLQMRSLEQKMAALEGKLQEARSTDYAEEKRAWASARERELDALEKDYNDELSRQATLKEDLARMQRELLWAQDHVDFCIKHQPDTGVCSSCGQALPGDGKHQQEKEESMRVLRSIEQHVSNLRNNIARSDQDLDRIEAKAAKVEKEGNPWATRQRDAQARVQGLEDEMAALSARFDALTGRFSLAKSWARWFKDLRLSQIGESLAHLQVEANNALSDLGLADWSLQFEVDRETAKGSIQRGFTTTILSPSNSKPVPWESWSGGEAQRLRIATQMGLASQGRDHTGTQFGLEVWDEPTDGMEAEGVHALLTALAARAQREQRQIWVVDHSKVGFAGFAGVAVATKTSRGTVFDLSGLPV